MAITKSLSAVAIDQKLNYIKNNCTMVIYTTHTTNPASAAAISAGGTALVVRSGLTAADFTVVSGVSVTANAAVAPITALAGGTATCVIFKTGTTNTDGVILGITTGTTVITSGQQYIPSAITWTENQPV